jgi:hypothetical protein
MHEIIQEPPGQLVEWNEWKVSKRLNTDPKGAAIVSKKVFRQGNIIRDGRRERIRDSLLFYMKVEPRVPRFAECLRFSRVRYVVCQLTRNNHSMSLGEDNSINVIVGRVRYFLLNGLDGVVYIAPPMVRKFYEFLSLDKL